MWQINKGGRKEAISLTCPQWRVNGLIPPIEITAPDCAHQKLSCITLKRQRLNVYPRFPVLPPAFVSYAALYYPWWKYNLPLICVPKPYKSKSSKVATFLHRYYVAFPAPSFNQERLITRDLDCYSFVTAHLRDGSIETRKKREKCEKNRSSEITLSSPRRWQQKTEHPDIFFFQRGIRAQLFSFSTSDHTPLLFLMMYHIR